MLINIPSCDGGSPVAILPFECETGGGGNEGNENSDSSSEGLQLIPVRCLAPMIMIIAVITTQLPARIVHDSTSRAAHRRLKGEPEANGKRQAGGDEIKETERANDRVARSRTS